MEDRGHTSHGTVLSAVPYNLWIMASIRWALNLGGSLFEGPFCRRRCDKREAAPDFSGRRAQVCVPVSDFKFADEQEKATIVRNAISWVASTGNAESRGARHFSSLQTQHAMAGSEATVLRPCPGSSFCCLLRLECRPAVSLGLREWLECELDLLTQYDPKKVCFLGSC